jgi:hypothetical protein
MSRPIALCLEYAPQPDGRERFLQCAALPSERAGVSLDDAGTLIWEGDPRLHVRLAVSTDDRLVLFRAAGTPAVTVHRGGRSLDAPEGKPVLLLQGDELQLRGGRIRLHVHGPIDEVPPPRWISPEREAASVAPRSVGRWAAAALALGAALSAGACKGKAPERTEDAQETIEVREEPPMMPRNWQSEREMTPPMAELPDAAAPAATVGRKVPGTSH